MKKLISIAACSLLIGIATQASAYYDPQSELEFQPIDLGVVGQLDKLIWVDYAGNANEERDVINDILETNYTKEYLVSQKIEFTEKSSYTDFFYRVYDGDEDYNAWAFELPDEPANFTIKTGGKDQYLWVFDNQSSANWGVIQEGMQLASLSITETMPPGSFTLNNGNITSMSHLTPTGTSVPEPEMMLLFGTGIVGIAGVAMRRRKK